MAILILLNMSSSEEIIREHVDVARRREYVAGMYLLSRCMIAVEETDFTFFSTLRENYVL